MGNDAAHAVEFFREDAEIEFVVYLQNHFRANAFRLETGGDAYHGNLDNVGRSALNGSVHGVALCIAAHNGIARVDVWQVAAATAKRFDITQFFGAADAVVNIFPYAGIGLEIIVNQFFCLRSAYFHTLGKAKGRNAIDDAEISRLGFAPLVARHFFERLLKDAGGSGGMNVFAIVESLDKMRVAAKVCHEAQFYLRVVGREENLSFLGDKGFADFAAVLAAHRNVLQVGVRR